MMQCTVIVLVTHRGNNNKYAKKMIHSRRSKMIEMRYSSERYENKDHFLFNRKLRPPTHQTDEDENDILYFYNKNL